MYVRVYNIGEGDAVLNTKEDYTSKSAKCALVEIILKPRANVSSFTEMKREEYIS